MNKTAIAWTDATWNPWYGCRKVSAGCKNCYMFRDMGRYGKDPNIVQRSRTTFNAPLRWKEPAKVFTCSWSDFFIEEADSWRGEAWEIIKKTPHLTYQICTKRPERIAAHLPSDWGTGYPNVWMGATAENQEQLDGRVFFLLKVPAPVHWLSIEPMLGPVDLSKVAMCEWYAGGLIEPRPGTIGGKAMPAARLRPRIDWVIVGGESGPGYRLMDLDWARSIRDQCQSAGVAYFFKQESGPRPGTNAILDGKEWHEFPK